MQLKSFIIFFLFYFTTFIAFAQLTGTKQKDVIDEDNVFFDGVVSDYYTGEKLSNVSIQAIANGNVVAAGTSDANGKYKMVLEFDKEYTITFSKAGLIGKTITLNSFGVPDNKRSKVPDMGAEITLFKPNDCIKSELFGKPIGKAVYFADKNIMDWDMEYSMTKLAALNKMLDDCSKQVEKKEKDFEAAMAAADKVFAKQDWETAKTGYQKALTVFPDKTEPKDRLKLIETELTKKAEAEKQRAEEKLRAEKEALAKAEKETAANKEAVERLAKEKAEKEVLAKAEAEKNELAKAEVAAKKAEEERLAKEQKAAEAKQAEEAALKAQLEKEAAANKKAENSAKKEEVEAISNAKEEGKDKIVAQKEAQKRAALEDKAKKQKEAAAKKEEEERKAKEQASKLAQQAEQQRAENKVVLLQEKEEVKDQLIIQKEEEKKSATIKGSSTIKIKRTNKGRFLYEVPNKTGNGRGARPVKHMVL